ncbi:MAG TPA: GYD domain-containing protein [Roseiflexaceae bacterium]
MATYIMLSRLTDKGAETVKENPARITAVDKELEAYGVTVKAQYAVLGPYDFVNIVEAPDNMAVARVAAMMASRGAVRIQTLAAIPIEEFIAGFK